MMVLLSLRVERKAKVEVAVVDALTRNSASLLPEAFEFEPLISMLHHSVRRNLRKLKTAVIHFSMDCPAYRPTLNTFS
jgi:hypothetical protein